MKKYEVRVMACGFGCSMHLTYSCKANSEAEAECKARKVMGEVSVIDIKEV